MVLIFFRVSFEVLMIPTEDENQTSIVHDKDQHKDIFEKKNQFGPV